MIEEFRSLLLSWYARSKRDLPWRRTRDPYRIWLSEVMLQQTRVAAVLPYYERFLERFPTVEALASAPEAELLRAWAGLGYYSRARNLQKAACAIAAGGAFPREYEALRALPGVGEYTAAAVASIAFNQPHAALDGNVLRVIARIDNDATDIAAPATRRRFRQRAEELLDPDRPGEYNQAMMELGATVCLPKGPLCLLCPVQAVCKARTAGTERELPVKLRRMEMRRIERTLLVVERSGSLLLWQRGEDAAIMPGFWELPEPEHLPKAEVGDQVGSFRHSITNHDYRFTIAHARISRAPKGFEWVNRTAVGTLPLSTVARKALHEAEVFL